MSIYIAHRRRNASNALTPLLAAWRAYSCLDVCLDVCVASTFLQILTPPTIFDRFSRNLAHVFHVLVWTKLCNRFAKF